MDSNTEGGSEGFRITIEQGIAALTEQKYFVGGPYQSSEKQAEGLATTSTHLIIGSNPTDNPADTDYTEEYFRELMGTTRTLLGSIFGEEVASSDLQLDSSVVTNKVHPGFISYAGSEGSGDLYVYIIPGRGAAKLRAGFYEEQAQKDPITTTQAQLIMRQPFTLHELKTMESPPLYPPPSS